MLIRLLLLSFFYLVACSSESVTPAEPAKKEEPKGPAITEPEAKVPHKLKATFQQINRENRIETFHLDPGKAFTETMVKASPAEVRGKIDILIVVDNSGSMYEEQKNLSTKIAPLLSEIEDQDWRIMVITTDSPCPTNKKLPFEKDTENLMAEFEDAIDVGTSGSGEEKAIEVTYEHLHGTEQNEKCHAASWMRQAAGFSMIILSDEDEDKSTTVGPARFINALQQFGYEAGFNARVFGIISKPDEPCPSAMQPAKIYDDLIVRTAGIAGDICANDYTETLEMISVMLTDLVVSEMKLQHVPEPSSLKVFLNGQPMDPEYWRQAGNLIVFAYTFVTGDSVKVEYVTEYQRSFPLKRDPSELKVIVDGQDLASEHFTVIKENELTRSKHLLHIPDLSADSKEVKVNYKENTALIERFSFPDYDGGELNCTLNGAAVVPSYHAADGSISFNPSPSDGEIVYCDFYPQ